MVESVEKAAKSILSNINNKTFYKKQQFIRSLPVEFVFLTLPYNKIDGLVYEKESDKAVLSITSGYNSEKKQHYGIPYGVYPRMILYFICSEIKRTNKKEIHLGKDVQDILEKMYLTERGVRNDGYVLKAFKEQLLRLTNALIKVTSKKEIESEKDTQIHESSLKIVKSVTFWKKSTQVDYKIIITDDFFNYLTNASITVFDTKLLHSIKSSPITLDLYVLFNYKAYIANRYKKDLFISFSELYSYFGTKDTFKSFKYNLKRKIADLLEIYQDLHIDLINTKLQSGVLIKRNSQSTVQPDLFVSNYLTE